MTPRAGALAVAVMLAAAGVAEAGPPWLEDAEMACVYKRLTADLRFETVAEVFLYDSTPEEQIGQAGEMVQTATIACTKEHGWTEGQAASAAELGIYGATVDYLVGEMRSSGVSQAAVDAMMSYAAAMSDDDVRNFEEADWRSDLSFTRPIKAALIASGMPDKDFALDASLDIMEVSAMARLSVRLFELGASEG